MYGESELDAAAVAPNTGLSPRVRGILRRLIVARARQGSIPACTGNPDHGGRSAALGVVYPRVYGESRLRYPNGRCMVGLSPRVRGIPAGAVR